MLMLIYQSAECLLLPIVQKMHNMKYNNLKIDDKIVCKFSNSYLS